MKKKILIMILALSVLTGCEDAMSASGRTSGTAPTVSDILSDGLKENGTSDNTDDTDTPDAGTASGSGGIVASPDPTPAPSAKNEDPATTGSSGSSADAASAGNDGSSADIKFTDLSATEGIDVDLTLLSSTMVYSEVYNMMYLPEDFVGKVIKMEGTYMEYRDEATGTLYRCCIIQDATACCAQGIEFLPVDPEACPEEGDTVTVVGTFDTYMEGQNLYCTLRDATIL